MKRLLERTWRMATDALIRWGTRDPYLHLPGYMNRYWILRPRRWLPVSVRLHHILRSDNDRHLHDHPWPYLSIILRGGYYELTQETKARHSLPRWHGERSVLIRRSTHRHALGLRPRQTTWTLFVMGPVQQEWGFWTEAGKVPWHEYLRPDEVAEQRAAHRAFGARRF